MIFSDKVQQFFEKIVDTPSPSGYEKRCQNIFKEYACDYVDDVYEDKFGNIIAHKTGTGKPKLMISAHIDEIGFVVKHIDENGFVYILPIGGVDMMLLPGMRLALHHKENSFIGIVGRKPIHLLNEMERNKISYEDLWVDCGFTNKEHALLSIDIGDPITFVSEPVFMSEDYLTTRSADNKIGNAILMELMSKMLQKESQYDLYFVSTRQEEIGLRGGITAASTINPDYAIIIDATHATDYPSIKTSFYGEIKLGKGPSICISPDSDEILRTQLLDIARYNALPHQIDVQPNMSGTEAKAIQLQHGGVKTSTISFPVRYMHSASEIISKNDIQNLISILYNLIVRNENKLSY